MAGFGHELVILRGDSGLTDVSGNGYSPFDDPADSTAITDSAFDIGETERVIVDGIVASGTEFFMGFWNKRSTQQRFKRIVSWADDAYAGLTPPAIDMYGYSSGTAEGSVRVLYNNSNGPTLPAELDVWNLFVVTQDDDSLRGYANGSLVFSSAANGNLNPALWDSFTIGGTPNVGSSSGLWDDCRISLTPLSTEEVAAWWAAGRGYDVGGGSTPRKRRRQVSGIPQ